MRQKVLVHFLMDSLYRRFRSQTPNLVLLLQNLSRLPFPYGFISDPVLQQMYSFLLLVHQLLILLFFRLVSRLLVRGMIWVTFYRNSVQTTH